MPCVFQFFEVPPVVVVGNLFQRIMAPLSKRLLPFDWIESDKAWSGDRKAFYRTQLSILRPSILSKCFVLPVINASAFSNVLDS